MDKHKVAEVNARVKRGTLKQTFFNSIRNCSSLGPDLFPRGLDVLLQSCSNLIIVYIVSHPKSLPYALVLFLGGWSGGCKGVSFSEYHPGVGREGS